MGNRATVIFAAENWKRLSPAIYLHWNGGPESVHCFLDEMDRREIRVQDTSYETARFIHIVGDFFDQDSIAGLSLGVNNGPKSLNDDSMGDYASEDNGLYVVMRGYNEKTKKYTREVRRFESRFKDGKYEDVVEKTKAQVKSETRKARNYKNGMGEKYVDSIKKAFLKITKGKEIRGD